MSQIDDLWDQHVAPHFSGSEPVLLGHPSASQVGGQVAEISESTIVSRRVELVGSVRFSRDTLIVCDQFVGGAEATRIHLAAGVESFNLVARRLGGAVVIEKPAPPVGRGGEPGVAGGPGSSGRDGGHGRKGKSASFSHSAKDGRPGAAGLAGEGGSAGQAGEAGADGRNNVEVTVQVSDLEAGARLELRAPGGGGGRGGPGGAGGSAGSGGAGGSGGRGGTGWHHVKRGKRGGHGGGGGSGGAGGRGGSGARGGRPGAAGSSGAFGQAGQLGRNGENGREGVLELQRIDPQELVLAADAALRGWHSGVGTPGSLGFSGMDR